MLSIQTIDHIANIVRHRLSLPTPLTLTSLCTVIKQLGGKCIPDATGMLQNKEAMLITNSNTEHTFVIVYDNKMSEQKQLFAIAHELGHLLLHT